MGAKYCWKYFKLYIAQVFDIGNSAGSLLTEVITLFRTFQSVSAPSEFVIKFSPEFTGMFSWATDLVEIISNSVHTTPFLNFELFSIYSFIFPLTILTFISTTVYGFSFFGVFFLFLGLSCLGFGVGLYFDEKKNRKISIGFMAVGSIISIIFLIIFCYQYIKRYIENKNNSIDEDEIVGVENLDSQNESISEVNTNYKYQTMKDKIYNKISKYRFVFSFICAALVFYGTMLRFMEKRWRLTIMVTVVVCVLTVAAIVIEFLFKHFNNTRILYYQKKLSGFLVNLLSLFVIPTTEIFFELIEEKDFKDNWFIKVAYIYNSLALPLFLIITMIVIKHPNIEEKYREPKYCNKFNYFYCYEFIDMACQISYAICAAKDLLVYCLGIEIFLFVLIVGFRPFSSISEHFLSGGNSLILIISNGTLFYFSKHNSDYFTVGWSMFFIVIACIPAIVSFYVFFIWDFEIKPEESDDVEDEEDHKDDGLVNDSKMKLCKVATFLSPFAWFFFALNMPYTIMKFNFSD